MNNSLCHRLLTALLLGLCLVCTGQGWATTRDLVTERAWLEDPTGAMSWQDVQQSNDWHIETRSKVISRGYGSSPIWFRLRIDPVASGLPSNATLKMRIRPSYLDELVLFDPLQSPAEQAARGDLQARTDSVEPRPSWSYSLPAGQSSRYVWVRLKTTSTRLAHIEVMDEAAMQRSNMRIEHIGALYLGTLFVFVVWGTFQLVFQRDWLSLTFVVYQITALLFGISFLGYSHLYASQWLSPKALNLCMNVLGILSTYMVFIFSNQLMGTFRAYTWRKVLNGSLHLVFAVSFLLLANDQIRTALQVNMSIIFVLPIMQWLIAVFTPIDRHAVDKAKIPKSAAVTYFSVSLAIALLASMPALNLVPATEISHYVVSLYSVCSGLMMMMILQYRSIQNIKEHSRLTAQTLQAQQRAEQEKQFRQETERLLAMLGHELKTPLSTLMLQVNDPQIPPQLSRGLGNAVMDMNHVIERTIQAGHLEQDNLDIRRVSCDLPDWLLSLVDSLPESNRVQTEIAPGTHKPLETDVYLLTIIVRNLLDNALKYSPVASVVSAQLRQSVNPAEWRLTISNRPGRAGWPEASKVFEKYYRSPAANYRSGTGLGLFLIKSLADKLGYRVEYQPNEHSIVFHLVIPVASQAH